MEMFKHRPACQGLWLGVVAVMVVTVLGCTSTTIKTEAVTVAEDAASPSQVTQVEVTATSSHAGETDAQTSASDDPHASRGNPFSEDSIKALEASLRPLEAIPTQTQATVSKD